MTWPYSNDLKLIEAYLKYSQLYQNCKKDYKHFLFKLWLQEVSFDNNNNNNNNNDNDNNDNNSKIITPFENFTTFCQMCGCTTIINNFMCCNKCLFPALETENDVILEKQQLFTFALLSICYYRHKKTIIDKQEQYCCKRVWLKRLQITWKTASTPFVCYFAKTLICMQCRVDNFIKFKNFDCEKELKIFNENFFCINCLFPLFDRLIFIPSLYR
ncbi:ac52 [Oxyplax ochracea nucleopolyhedrovirus]|uniref:Ac52 n=1 Tax=Oxyplax ochracea nucleopolyhedrovirus TaxID=2083176 RepID=A0A2L0WU61_9ABAC|nr:ac52 [Oxyplax ochracea nucleopolyhedrovirus]AVA31182.1 ac52 [Oxyplax ochracea nucleopolyhedrovirus]